jgi:hypothetical protein
VSLAFTNPIFVDFGGDGFDPPGLAPEALAAARAPLETEAGRAAQRARTEHDLESHPSLYRISIPREAVERARRNGS